MTMSVTALIAQRIDRFTRRDLARRFAALGFRRGAEIGVRQGAFSLALCEAIPGLELLCVDAWTHYKSGTFNYNHERNYQIATNRLTPYRATLVRALSMDAVRDVPIGSLDFVYIDANHDYAFVRDDITAWSARVRSGGIVSGDDYVAPGVRRAVDEFVDAHGIVEWWLTDDRNRRNRKNEVFTSWFWMKT